MASVRRCCPDHPGRRQTGCPRAVPVGRGAGTLRHRCAPGIPPDRTVPGRLAVALDGRSPRSRIWKGAEGSSGAARRPSRRETAPVSGAIAGRDRDGLLSAYSCGGSHGVSPEGAAPSCLVHYSLERTIGSEGAESGSPGRRCVAPSACRGPDDGSRVPGGAAAAVPERRRFDSAELTAAFDAAPVHQTGTCRSVPGDRPRALSSRSWSRAFGWLVAAA